MIAISIIIVISNRSHQFASNIVCLTNLALAAYLPAQLLLVFLKGLSLLLKSIECWRWWSRSTPTMGAKPLFHTPMNPSIQDIQTTNHPILSHYANGLHKRHDCHPEELNNTELPAIKERGHARKNENVAKLRAISIKETFIAYRSLFRDNLEKKERCRHNLTQVRQARSKHCYLKTSLNKDYIFCVRSLTLTSRGPLLIGLSISSNTTLPPVTLSSHAKQMTRVAMVR